MPAYPLECIIALAIAQSRTHEMTLSSIYNWMRTKLPYYRTHDGSIWKNTVRQTIAQSKLFVKKENDDGKAAVFEINTNAIATLQSMMDRRSDSPTLLAGSPGHVVGSPHSHRFVGASRSSPIMRRKADRPARTTTLARSESAEAPSTGNSSPTYPTVLEPPLFPIDLDDQPLFDADMFGGMQSSSSSSFFGASTAEPSEPSPSTDLEMLLDEVDMAHIMAYESAPVDLEY